MDQTTERQPIHDEAGTLPAFSLEAQEALAYRQRLRGMIGVASKVPPALKLRRLRSALFVRQDIWEMRHHMPENGHISSSSQVYLQETRSERDTALLLALRNGNC